MTIQQNKIAVFDLDGTLIETDAANSRLSRGDAEIRRGCIRCTDVLPHR